MAIDDTTFEALRAYKRGDKLSINQRLYLRRWVTSDPAIRDDIAKDRAHSAVVKGLGTDMAEEIEFNAVDLARFVGLVPPVSERVKRLAQAALDPNDPDHAEAMEALGLPPDAMREDDD